MSSKLDDFQGGEYLFDNYYQIGIAEKKIQTNSIKILEENKLVLIISEIDHLSDQLKSGFIEKVMKSISQNSKDVKIHYFQENYNIQEITDKYKNSKCIIWRDELPIGINYFLETGNEELNIYNVPSISSVINSQEHKTKLWVMLKNYFIK